jgi:hypothetical protein
METAEFSNLKASETAWTRQGTIYTGTSIIGMNFFLETKLHLFVDPANKIAYIGR